MLKLAVAQLYQWRMFGSHRGKVVDGDGDFYLLMGEQIMQNSVQLIEDSNAFVVRLTEDGKTSDQEFDGRAYAISYATGQAVRLKCLVQVDAARKRAQLQ